MCDTYLGENYDTVYKEPRQVYKVTYESRVGPYHGIDSPQNPGEWLWAEPADPWDLGFPEYRHGFHGFCCFERREDAEKYAKRFLRLDPSALKEEVVQVQVRGWIKRAEVDELPVLLAEGIMFPKEDSDVNQ